MLIKSGVVSDHDKAQRLESGRKQISKHFSYLLLMILEPKVSYRNEWWNVVNEY